MVQVYYMVHIGWICSYVIASNLIRNDIHLLNGKIHALPIKTILRIYVQIYVNIMNPQSQQHYRSCIVSVIDEILDQAPMTISGKDIYFRYWLVSGYRKDLISTDGG